MTDHPRRAAVAFLLALAGLAGLAYVAQQTLYRRDPVLDLTPAVAAPPQVPAPVTHSGPGVTGLVIDARWLRTTSARSGVPLTALRAYARAELLSPSDCGVGWTTLAGVGWVESQHGTLGGRTLGDDGRSSSRILGPALDGEDGVRAIPATAESTRWHGDARWDHAVGPMQFIPTTWELWGADGDQDGTEDPNDIDDAALAAADYLCADDRDLTTAEGWTGGVLSYNHARVYVDSVHAAATAYAERAGA